MTRLHSRLNVETLEERNLLSGNNLILNGDFSQGNTGFSTQYTYSPGSIGAALSYDVVDDPSHSRPNDPNAISYHDHTTGTGLMMAVNGATTPDTLVWSQTVSVTTNTTYDFSLWLSSWFAAVPASFAVQFNGATVGTPIAPSTTAVWEQFSASWDSGAATSLTIDIRMTNSADIGGDFALDDLSLVPRLGSVGPGDIAVAAGDQAFDLIAVDLNAPVTLGPGTYRASQFHYQFTDFAGYLTTGTVAPLLLIGNGTDYFPVAIGSTITYAGATGFVATAFGGSDTFTLISASTVYGGLYWEATQVGTAELRMPVGYASTGNSFVVYGGAFGTGAIPPAVGTPISGSAAANFSRTYDFTIDIDSSVNHAPVLDASGSMSLLSIQEDATANVGTKVADLLASAGDRITDPDAGALEGIAVTGADTTNESWEYTTDGSIWLPLGSVSDSNARLLAADATTRVRFVPNADYNGTVPTALTFRAWDQTGGINGTTASTSSNGGATAFSTATETASLNVTEVNDAPIGASDGLPSLREDTVAQRIAFGDLLGNDNSGPANEGSQSLTIVAVDSPVGGTVEIQGNEVVFTPTADYNGPASFTYTLRDDGTTNGNADFLTATATVSFHIITVNDAPSFQAGPDLTLLEDAGTQTLPGWATSLSRGPANESTQSLSFEVVVTATTGQLAFAVAPAISSAGTLTFRTAPNSNGSATVRVILRDNGGTTDDGQDSSAPALFTITVDAVNDLPVANSNNYRLNEDEPLQVTAPGLLGNDTDAEGDPLTAIQVTGPLHGTLSLNSSGSFVYTPFPNYNGPDSFTYKANDGSADSGVTTVTLTIDAVDDPPVNHVPLQVTTAEDTPFVFQASTRISVTDFDVGGGQVRVVLAASNGLLSLASSPGEFSTILQLDDTLAAVNSALDDLRFTPLPDFNGLATLQIVTNDLGNSGAGGPLTDTDSVVLVVSPANDPPAAVPDLITVTEDAGLTVLDVLANDSSSPDSGETLQFIAVTQPSSGTVSLAQGVVRYVPSPNFTGLDSFTYTISDGNGGTATATVVMAVTPVNDAPVLTAPPVAGFVAGLAVPVAGLRVEDSDVSQGNGRVEVALAVQTGVLNLGTIPGLVFDLGDGRADGSMRFTGNLASVNAALASLTYQATLEAPQNDLLAIEVDDLGNTGADGPQSASTTIQLEPAPGAFLVADPYLGGRRSLVVQGTGANETLTVSPLGADVTVYSVTLQGGRRTVAGVTGRVLAFGFGGNDTINVAGVKLQTILVGGEGNDVLIGGLASDTLTGGMGDDTLDGRAGTDLLREQGDANVTLVQGTPARNGSLRGLGNDVLIRNRIERADLTGGGGNNVLDASRFTGQVTLDGGAGNDVLLGGSGNDILIGKAGDDTLVGGLGRDLVIGGMGADTLRGNGGEDILVGTRTLHDDRRGALDAIMAERV